jgi:hypothetical protein
MTPLEMRELLLGLPANPPVVAIDGRSGAGKSGPVEGPQP